MGDAFTGSAVPCRLSGVEPSGRLHGSGFAEQQWLVRREHQFVQVGELLYRVVELADGARTLDDIARELTASTQWEVTPEDVALIVQAKLVPLGLIAPAHGAQTTPRPRPASPLLADARLRVLGPRPIDRVARVLGHLFHPPLLVVAILVIVASQAWLFLRGDPSAAIQEVVSTPLSLPLIAGLLIAAGVFHEFGHAAALRYGGGRARGMGIGVYLFIPVLYTDVTESYRLRRGARVRTDLGGLYFHLLAAAGLIGVGAATGSPFPLVAAFLVTLDVGRQLIPFIRLDGYWLLADLTGIPDLFAHAGPRLRRRFGKKPDGPLPPPLRPRVRRIFAAYVALTLPGIVGMLAYVAWHAPAVFRRTVAAVSDRVAFVSDTALPEDMGNALLAVIEIVLLAVPTVGLAFFLMVLLRAGTRLAWRHRAAPEPAPSAGAVAQTSSAATARRRPTSGRAGEPVSLQAAIADHLELTRRHAEEDRAASATPYAGAV